MEDLKFKSLNELYARLLPALKSKKKELNKKGITYIYEEDIWNYLKDSKWHSSVKLTLDKMVDDILNTDNSEFVLYMKELLKQDHRDITEDKIDNNLL